MSQFIYKICLSCRYIRPNKKICSFPVARPTLNLYTDPNFFIVISKLIFSLYKLIMVVNLLNAFMLQLDTIIQLLALFKLILYSNSFKIINVTLYFTFDSIVFLGKKKIGPTDPISNHKVTRNEHIFLFGFIIQTINIKSNQIYP